MRKEYPDNEIIKSMIVGKLAVEKYLRITISLLENERDRTNSSPEKLYETIKRHYMIINLVNILHLFGEIDKNVCFCSLRNLYGFINSNAESIFYSFGYQVKNQEIIFARC